MTRYGSIVLVLESVIDELDGLSFGVLRDASERGIAERPMQDRAITKARRAVEKAVHELRAAEDLPD